MFVVRLTFMDCDVRSATHFYGLDVRLTTHFYGL